MTNTFKLKGCIVANRLTLEQLSKLMSLSQTTLSYKINNKREFKSSEIKKLQDILNLSDNERDDIFFNQGND